ncbi:hypothetical protein G7046_g788 [Stylonectria norvegica]|nr:hypothetical protein G7046_g788 [Stylonectria norvegica]
MVGPSQLAKQSGDAEIRDRSAKHITSSLTSSRKSRPSPPKPYLPLRRPRSSPQPVIMAADEPAPATKSVMGYLHEWGTNSLPPSLLATLITALHGRPLQALPLFLFTPPLLFSSYLNLSGYPTGSAGLAAAWSGLYALLALRRHQSLRGKMSIRGVIRGTAIGLGTANCLAGGWVYFNGDLNKDAEARKERNRWGSKE